MNSKNKKIFIYWMLTIFGAIALSTVFFFLIFRFKELSGVVSRVIGILKPLIYGVAIAYLLKPMCNAYERKLVNLLGEKRKKAANVIAVAGSLVTLIVIVYLLLMIIIPQVANSISVLINTLPAKLEDASGWLDKTLEQDNTLSKYITEVYLGVKTDIVKWLDNVLSPNLQSIVEGVGTQIWNSVMFIKNLFIGLVVAVYLLISRRKFARHSQLFLYGCIKKEWAVGIINELKYADNIFVGFLNGKFLDSAIIGVICYVCCLLFKFPNAMLISVIIGVTNIIPFFGPFIGAVPATLLILMESPIKALWFMLFVLALQQVDGNIIGPKILGDSTGLSSFWVLFSILVFGGLWGFVGMVIGVPLFAVIYDIVRKIIKTGLAKNGCEEMIPEMDNDEN